jgi:hypothetical protein
VELVVDRTLEFKGHVYFIQAVSGEGPIKIGYTSRSPKSRLASLQTGNAAKLTIIGAHPGNQGHESRLHTRFAEFRLHGEWFRPAPPVLEFAALPELPDWWYETWRPTRPGECMPDWNSFEYRCLNCNALTGSIEICGACHEGGAYQLLENEFKQILVGLAMLSHGATQNWDSDGRGGYDAVSPPGELSPPHLEFKYAWDDAGTLEELAAVVASAREYLETHRRRPEVEVEGETAAERDARMIDEGEGWSAKEVALMFRCAAADVRRARIVASRDPETGRTVETPPGTSPIEAAKMLRERGMSLRAIELATRIPRSTLHDLFNGKKAA